MGTEPTFKLNDLCRRLEVRERDARYVLEQGHVPEGIDPNPMRGNHRRFNARQAVWLAMLLKLKEAGMKTPVAAAVADYAQEAMRTVTQNLSWDWVFQPWAGRFATEYQYLVEVGDAKYIRLVTDANPSRDGLYCFSWHKIGERHVHRGKVTPCITVRLDLSRIAAMLQGTKAE
jgi:hypothetical protein